jgi:uncharacterized membrane protein YsdA (DUF1294 family)/cold shock CspA family protein
MRITGKISRWQDDKGFGFIEPASGGPQVFLHASALQNRYRRPVSGDVVIFSRETDQKGRFQARDVVFAGETPKPKPTPKSKQLYQQKAKGPWRPKYWQYGLSAAFLVLLIAGAVEKYWGWKIIVYYCIASIVTFAMYSSDKFAAEHRNSRTPESTLQCLSLLGGWPGALVAQNFLRHKSRKTRFLILFWLMVFGNLVALYMLCFSVHAADIRMVLGI